MNSTEKLKMTLKIMWISAPGSYDVEKADKRVHESSSAYSFGVKYKESKTDDVPGKLKSNLNYGRRIVILTKITDFKSNRK